MKLLIIEDEKTLLENMIHYLQGEQYVCEAAAGYYAALEKIDLYDYDCILLDITLPDGNGLNLLQELKNNNKTDGVIIISAKDAIDDKITGLHLGADDYLSKPFHLSELSARIAAVIRRKKFQGNNLLQLSDIRIDLSSHQVTIAGKEVDLTRKEFDLLLFFAANKNKVVSKNAISAHLAGDAHDWPDNYDLVYSHIKNLKKKLSENRGADYIHSVYGVGYKLVI